MNIRVVCFVLTAICGWSQTRVDLKSQTRNVDFSAATSTKPVKIGTSLPATCSIGEVFFKSDAAAGSNLYLCAATDQWSAMVSGSSASSLFSSSTVSALPATCSMGDSRFVTDATLGSGGSNLYLCMASNTWVQFGYVAGGTGALAANCSSVPCVIDVTASVPLKAGANTWAGANDFSNAAKTAPFRIGATDPSVCDATAREVFFNTSSNTLKSCNSTNVWSALSGSTSGTSFSLGSGFFAPYGIGVGSEESLVNWTPDASASFACTQFVVPYSMSVSRVGVIVGTAPASGMSIAVGIMDSSFTMLTQGTVTDPPGSDSTVIPLASTVTLAPGIYYQCVGGQDTGTSLAAAMSGTGTVTFSKVMNNGSDRRIVACSNSTTGSGSTFALPSTCGTATARNYYPVIASMLLP